MSKRIWLSLAIVLTLFTYVYAQAPAPAPAASRSVPGAAALLDEAAALRGLSVLKPVTSGFKSRAEIEAMVIKDFAESSTPAEIEAQRKMLVAFSLIPKDFRYREFLVSLLTEQVAGFYQARTKQFFLADWNDPETSQPVIIHELTHALQDQHFNLIRFEKWPRGDGDRELAIHSLIEGDATAVMLNYVLKPTGMDIAKLPVSLATLAEKMSEGGTGEREQVMASAPAAIRESLLFPYSYGAGFVQELVKRQKWEQVSRAYTDLPQSTEQILHVEKYVSREMPVQIALVNPSAIPGAGWTRLIDEVNGEFGYQLIIAPYSTKAEAARAAAGWGGDRAMLYENTRTGEQLLLHVSEWDSANDAVEFFDAYGKRLKKLYADEKSAATVKNVQTYGDSRLVARMEMRGTRVIIIEGAPIALANRLESMSAGLWK